MIYLASPYSHPDPAVRQQRFEDTQRFTAQAMNEGYAIFSPIVYGHHMALAHGLPTDAEYWRLFNECIIQASVVMWVLRLEDWQKSNGVMMELRFASFLDMKVEYKDI